MVEIFSVVINEIEKRKLTVIIPAETHPLMPPPSTAT
jgi:hypothetical protein